MRVLFVVVAIFLPRVDAQKFVTEPTNKGLEDTYDVNGLVDSMMAAAASPLGNQLSVPQAVGRCDMALQRFAHACRHAIAMMALDHAQKGFLHGGPPHHNRNLNHLCNETKCTKGVDAVIRLCNFSIANGARGNFMATAVIGGYHQAMSLQEQCKSLKSAIEHEDLENLYQQSKILATRNIEVASHQEEYDGQDQLPPLVIIPALTASTLEAVIKRDVAANPFCTLEGVEKIWPPDVKQLMKNPLLLGCWLEEMTIKVDTEESRKNGDEVLIEPTGLHVHPEETGAYYGDTTESGSWGWDVLLFQLQDYGYQTGKNIYGAPYDWRHGPAHWYKHSWRRLKTSVESWVSKHSGLPAIFIADSMGGPYFTAFLLHADGIDDAWKRKHVAGFVISSPPLAGVRAALALTVWGTVYPVTGNPHFGYDVDIPGPHPVLRDLLRGFGSLAWLLPKIGTGLPLIKLPPAWGNLTLTAEDLPWLFEELGSEGFSALYDLGQKFPTSRHPGVKMLCMHGIEYPTYGLYRYDDTPAAVTLPVSLPGVADSKVQAALKAGAAAEELLPGIFAHLHENGILQDMTPLNALSEVEGFRENITEIAFGSHVKADPGIDTSQVQHPSKGSARNHKDALWRRSVARLLAVRYPDAVEPIKGGGDGLVGNESLSTCEGWKNIKGLPNVQVHYMRNIKHSWEKHLDKEMAVVRHFVLGIAGVNETAHSKASAICNAHRPVCAHFPAPVLTFAGREFHGKSYDFEDLAFQSRQYENGFCGAFSVAFRARWDALGSYSRIIDFGSGPMQNNILIANKEESETLIFAILNGRTFTDFRSVEAPLAITLGEEHEYLCTVSDSGRMQIYIDGQLAADNPSGHAPIPSARQHLYVGKSAWKENALFRGSIKDIRVWNAFVTVDALNHDFHHCLTQATSRSIVPRSPQSSSIAPSLEGPIQTRKPSMTIAMKLSLAAFVAVSLVFGLLCAIYVSLRRCKRRWRRSKWAVSNDEVDVPLCEVEREVEHEILAGTPYEGVKVDS